MNISRYITEQSIKLEMTTRIGQLEEGSSADKWLQNGKEKILDELVSLLEVGNRIGNRTKLLLDFVNREKQASNGIGDGIAIPHIRSKQAKEFMIAIARSTQGYNFDSLDGQPAHLFFIMAAPPYDDNLYLKVFKALAEKLQYENFRDELMAATSPGEIYRIIRSME